MSSQRLRALSLSPKEADRYKKASITWTLRLSGVRQIIQRTWKSTVTDDLPGRAAQLAYYFFFSLFPGLIAASALLGTVASSGHEFSNRLISYLSAVMPPSAYRMVSDIFTQTSQVRNGGRLVLGALTALWSASAGTAAIQDALNSVYKVKEGRSMVRARIEAVLLTVTVGLLFGVALAVLLCGDLAASYLGQFLDIPLLMISASRILAWPLAFSVLALAFALVYYIAPDVEHAKWKWITPGSVVGISLWLASSIALRLYLHFFDSYSVTYGSLGAVIVLLIWFYFTGLALLLGAEVNSVLEASAAEHGAPDAKLQGEKSPQ